MTAALIIAAVAFVAWLIGVPLGMWLIFRWLLERENLP